ncbi:MAG TPA: hypothetical protein VFR16_14445 [Agromyces mariniharenae]|nr:hypothetical protein [Agromyces mariniharenae]
MSDLLHWYARAHGPRAYRVVRAALDGETEAARRDAAAEAPETAPPIVDDVLDPVELTARA